MNTLQEIEKYKCKVESNLFRMLPPLNSRQISPRYVSFNTKYKLPKACERSKLNKSVDFQNTLTTLQSNQWFTEKPRELIPELQDSLSSRSNFKPNDSRVGNFKAVKTRDNSIKKEPIIEKQEIYYLNTSLKDI